jgi:hypothetical protein
MKKFKVCLAVLMIAMMMGGSAWAWNAGDHVKVAPNGKGDLLIFPWYFAYPGGYSTKITVTNTSNSKSVVAKVVYRSFNWSYELLDHLIILSPNDVWTGTLVNVNGVARLQSTDDSILGRQPSGKATDEDFANITPVDVPLWLPGCPFLDVPPANYADDVNTMGYIEVIEAAARTESVAGTGYAVGDRVAKRHIYDWYDPLTAPQIALFPPQNVLTGYQENTFGGSSTLKQANVFRDYGNTAKLSISTPTRLGEGADNTLAELEAAMGKLNVALPYIAKPNGDSSVHIFNFPTKLSQYGADSTCTKYVPYSNSPYWMLVNSKCETVTPNIYDLLENRSTSRYPFSPLPSGAGVCPEVELTFVLYNNPVYTEGWIRYNWNQSANLKTALSRSGDPIAYYGTPVLPSVMYWSATRTNPVEAHAAYDDGPVFNDGVGRVRLPYYQYSD